MRINQYIVAIGVSLLLTACATKSNPENPGHDGTRLFGGGPSSAIDVQKMKTQLEQNVRSSTAKAVAENALAGDIRPGIIAIGNVSSLRELDVAARPVFYKKSYLPSAEKWHPGVAPSMTETEFSATVAGYTAVVTWSIPGMISRRTTAAVLAVDVSRIDFPGKRMASFWGATGDLVAVRSNSDGIFFITAVLCKESTPDFKKCAEQFVLGSFDQNTGAELDKDLSPKSDGNRIDVTTYKTIPKI